MGLQGPRRSGLGLEGPSGSMGRPTGSQGVKGKAYKVPAVQGIGLQGPRGSSGRPTGSKGVKG